MNADLHTTRSTLPAGTDAPHTLTGIDGDMFRGIFGGFPSGVTIVTATTREGMPVGMTVSAVMSLSLAPPQLLICLQSHKYTLQAIKATRKFAVNFLSIHQSRISDKFAGSAGDKFSDIHWHFGSATGAPVIDEVRAVAECQVDSLIESGDHTIVIGHIVAGELSQTGPLVYHSRKYVGLTDMLEAVPA